MSPSSTDLGALGRVFAVAVAVNYPWEVAESPLYRGMRPLSRMWLHCLLPSVGDGVLVLGVVGSGWLAFGTPRWYERLSVSRLALSVIAGSAIGIAVELVAVHLLGRWSYEARMPLLPGLGVGAIPVAQMAVLPSIVFRIAALWEARYGRISK